MAPKGANSSWATFGSRPKASSSSSASSPSKPASSLPEFLSLLAESGIPMRDALSLARKLLPLGLANDVALAGTTEGQLKKAGISDESERRILLAIGSKRVRLCPRRGHRSI